METPGYGVKMQWMHDPWVRGEDAVNAWDVDAWRPLGMGVETPGYGMWMHGDPWVWDVDAWRPLGMGCGCIETPGYEGKMQWMHGDPWVRGEDAVDAHGDPWVRGEDAVDAHGDPWVRGEDAVDAHGDPWVWGVDAWRPLHGRMHAEHGYMETQGADAERPLGMG